MTHHHWTADHEEFIRRHFEAELGDEPIYIRSESESGLSPCPHSCSAFTSTDLDLRMKVALLARGQWSGRGFSMAIPTDGQSFHKMSWPAQLNLCLHELAHHLADRQKILNDTEPPPDDSHPLSIAQRTDIPLATHINIFEHGPSFVRSELHIHRRASPDADLFAMQIFAEAYRSPAFSGALGALDDELRTGGNIVDVMATKAPEAFTALWPSDDERASERLTIGRRILEGVWAAHGLGLSPATT